MISPLSSANARQSTVAKSSIRKNGKTNMNQTSRGLFGAEIQYFRTDPRYWPALMRLEQRHRPRALGTRIRHGHLPRPRPGAAVERSGLAHAARTSTNG
jgi:hypothetical protein